MGGDGVRSCGFGRGSFLSLGRLRIARCHKIQGEFKWGLSRTIDTGYCSYGSPGLYCKQQLRISVERECCL